MRAKGSENGGISSYGKCVFDHFTNIYFRLLFLLGGNLDLCYWLSFLLGLLLIVFLFASCSECGVFREGFLI
jgi:hypothetical protein